MGILERLLTPAINEFKTFSPNGSIYAPNYIVTNGKVPESPLTTKQSKLHADNNSAGYSTGDDDKINNEVISQAYQYDDGDDSFPLPGKGELDYHKPKETTYISPSGDQVTVNYTSGRTYLMSFDPRTY
jgi:hypothetical protein